MVEQGILRQQTVRTLQRVGVPTFFGPSEPAEDEVSLYLWFGHVHLPVCRTRMGTAGLCVLYVRQWHNWLQPLLSLLRLLMLDTVAASACMSCSSGRNGTMWIQH